MGGRSCKSVKALPYLLQLWLRSLHFIQVCLHNEKVEGELVDL